MSVATDTAADLAGAIDAARRELAALEAERASLTGDAPSAVSWQQRRARLDDLPALLQGARIRLLEAEIAALEGQIAPARAEAARAAESSGDLWATAHAARASAEAADAYAGNADSHSRDLVARLAERKRQVASLTALMAADPGPLVRSRWQTGG
ncbi:MAG: hypothetical protein ACR2QA_04090 [Solirubrobacteraceae bacterium]